MLNTSKSSWDNISFSHSNSLANPMKCSSQSMGSIRLLSSSSLPFHRAESILLSPPSFSCRLLFHLSIISWSTFPFVPLPQIHVYIGTTFGSSTASPPLRSIPMIFDDIRCIWSTTEPLKHSSGWLKGYFQYPTSFSAKTRCHDSKATATQPPSCPRPPRRHKTSPLSPLMRWIAAWRSGRSEWRPFIDKWGRRFTMVACWSLVSRNGRTCPKQIFSPSPCLKESSSFCLLSFFSHYLNFKAQLSIVSPWSSISRR